MNPLGAVFSVLYFLTLVVVAGIFVTAAIRIPRALEDIARSLRALTPGNPPQSGRDT